MTSRHVDLSAVYLHNTSTYANSPRLILPNSNLIHRTLRQPKKIHSFEIPMQLQTCPFYNPIWMHSGRVAIRESLCLRNYTGL